MLLAVDVGNTNITTGLFKQTRLIKKAKVSAAKESRAHRQFFKRFVANNQLNNIIICSVVPKVLPGLKQNLYSDFGVRPQICGRDFKVPIRNLYRNPRQVGQDRLVNAYAGLKLYGKPLIVIDFGTAITFDCISQDGAYLGGIIVPGIDISFDSLFERAALLPMVKFKIPESLIGKDTVNSIRSGVVYGFASLCDGLVKRLKRQLKGKVKVIATGGYCEFIARYSKSIQKVDKDLTLKGLSILAS